MIKVARTRSAVDQLRQSLQTSWIIAFLRGHMLWRPIAPTALYEPDPCAIACSRVWRLHDLAPSTIPRTGGRVVRPRGMRRNKRRATESRPQVIAIKVLPSDAWGLIERAPAWVRHSGQDKVPIRDQGTCSQPSQGFLYVQPAASSR
jgi:hypothetical protein